MRVISGTAKGKTLKTIEGLDTRPTVDRVKEAVFGSIQFDLQDSRVLDLFAGSGAMGIEALSRGAAEGVFVENNARAMAVVKQNAQYTGVDKRSRFIESDFVAALSKISGEFDFIFIDPPYASDYYKKAMEIIADKKLLASGGRIICEHDREIGDMPSRLVPLKSKKYGKTYITYYAWNEME